MKERVTFIHAADDAPKPSQLELNNDTLRIKSLKAAREQRLTFSLEELPEELRRGLTQSHELHIRWTSTIPYPLTEPFSSTLSPGLHLLYTPRKVRHADALCPLLRKDFGVGAKCTKPEEVFSNLSVLSERFSSSATYQFYDELPSLNDLVTYIVQKTCAGDKGCETYAEALRFADYFDLDYDAISQAMTLNAFWHKSPVSKTWNYQIDSRGGTVKVEVGVMSKEKPTQQEELSMGGILITLGEENKKSPTLFSFPSRHHLFRPLSSATYSTSFVQPTGLHPTLRLNLPPSLEAPATSCALHTYVTLPSFLFVDKYQLSSPNFLASKNLRAVRSLSGEADLEAPDWAIKQWGSTLLLELATPKSPRDSSAESVYHADIPLHLRYLSPHESMQENSTSSPKRKAGLRKLSVPWPSVFWACPSDEGTKMNTNPFDRVNLGYDGLFGPRTMFYYLQPSSPGTLLVAELAAPVMDLQNANGTEFGTVSVVLLGFVWVCWKLARVVGSDLSRAAKREKEE